MATESQVASLKSAEHRRGVVLATESQVAPLENAENCKNALHVVVGTVQNCYEGVSVNPDVKNSLGSDSVDFLIRDAVHPV